MIRKTFNVLTRPRARRHGAAGLILSAAMVGMLATPAWGAAVHLILKNRNPIVNAGQVVEVELWFASAMSPAQKWMGADVLLQWNPALKWLGHTTNPALTGVIASSMPANPDVPNQRWWSAGAYPAQTAAVGTGTLITTLRFCATTPVNGGSIAILAGDSLTDTAVYDPTFMNVVGTRGSTVATVYAGAIPGDCDNDGDVDVDDFQTKFQPCFNGPNRPPRGVNCGMVDMDNDLDCDMGDFLMFQACFNGPNRAPKCVCH